MNAQTATHNTPPATRRRGLLERPVYGWGDSIPRKPSFREIMVEWNDAINFFQNRTRLLTALFTAFHFATGIIFLYFLFYHLSLLNLALISVISVLLSFI